MITFKITVYVKEHDLGTYIAVTRNLVVGKPAIEMEDNPSQYSAPSPSPIQPRTHAPVHRLRGSKRPAKYRNPNNEFETWAGFGHPPNWMREQERLGHSRDEFLIQYKQRSGLFAMLTAFQDDNAAIDTKTMARNFARYGLHVNSVGSATSRYRKEGYMVRTNTTSYPGQPSYWKLTEAGKIKRLDLLRKETP